MLRSVRLFQTYSHVSHSTLVCVTPGCTLIQLRAAHTHASDRESDMLIRHVEGI